MGHTKFSPDWCFGLFKQLYRKTKVGSINNIAEVVKRSATVNHPQLIGEYDGTTHVKMYDWSSFFDSHTIQTSLKGISKMQHFHFTADHPGYVFVKNSNDASETKIKLLKDTSWKPQKFLTRTDHCSWFITGTSVVSVREFCPDEVKDLVSPQPTIPLQ